MPGNKKHHRPSPAESKMGLFVCMCVPELNAFKMMWHARWYKNISLSILDLISFSTQHYHLTTVPIHNSDSNNPPFLHTLSLIEIELHI